MMQQLILASSTAEEAAHLKVLGIHAARQQKPSEDAIFCKQK